MNKIFPLFLLTCGLGYAQLIPPSGPGGGGGGTGTVTTVATGCGTSGGPITTAGTIVAIETVNGQTGTTYTIQGSDCGKLLNATNASGMAITLPQAGVVFYNGWFMDITNEGAGNLVITPVTSTIDGGANLTLTSGQGVHLVSNGTNYFTVRGMGNGGGGGTPGGTNGQCQYNNSGVFGGVSGCTSNGTTITLVAPNLGTPTTLILTNATALPLSGLAGLATGMATFLGASSSANLSATLTDETGSGLAVFSTSPTLVTPNLGTPTVLTLTNATALPISGIAGLGTGVATALAAGVSGTGAFCLVTGSACSAGGGITALTGDVTASGTGSVTATLATVNSNVGLCGDATHVGQVTLNGKGLTTGCTAIAITFSGITQLTGDGTAGPGSGSQTFTLATVNSSPGSCGDGTHVCQITTNGKGLVISQTAVAITGGGGGATNLSGMTDFQTTVSGNTVTVAGGNVNFVSTSGLPVTTALAGGTILKIGGSDTGTFRIFANSTGAMQCYFSAGITMSNYTVSAGFAGSTCTSGSDYPEGSIASASVVISTGTFAAPVEARAFFSRDIITVSGCLQKIGNDISSNCTGTGTVTSVVMAGTTNQISVAGTCSISSSGTCTFSLPTSLIIPGTLNGMTFTTSTGTFTLANGKTLTVSNTLAFSGTDSTSLVFPNPSGVTSGNCTSMTKSGSTITFADAGNPCGTGSGGGGTTVAPYTVTISSQTSYSLTAATHGQGLLATPTCWDNSTPRVSVACAFTRNTSGDLVFTFAPAFTGLIQVGSGGGLNIAPYIVSLSSQTSSSVSASTHGKGVDPSVRCYDNSSPARIAVCDWTNNGSGDLVFRFLPSFTGTININY